MKFRKHPSFMGKYLSINVGGGDKRVGDNEILVGPQYAKYVGFGWLVPADDAPDPAPAPAPAPQKAPVPPPKAEPPKVEAPKAEPPKAEEPEEAGDEDGDESDDSDDGSVTKSSADKVPGPGGRRRRRGSKG